MRSRRINAEAEARVSQTFSRGVLRLALRTAAFSLHTHPCRLCALGYRQQHLTGLARLSYEYNPQRLSPLRASLKNRSNWPCKETYFL